MCDAHNFRETNIRPSPISRRGFLAAGVGVLATCALPRWASAAAQGTARDRYLLFLERVGTGEFAEEPFTLDGKTLYWPGYKKLCAVLRDEHVPPELGFVQINVATIEALWAVQSYLRGANIYEPIMVHSGYRTPQTNAQTEGAARLSYHMWGKAVDFHVPGVALSDLAGICEGCPISGGVGYYPEGWVHMDTGPKRAWVG
jgi:uncharacterized protein YcbK (DUF882 family)